MKIRGYREQMIDRRAEELERKVRRYLRDPESRGLLIQMAAALVPFLQGRKGEAADSLDKIGEHEAAEYIRTTNCDLQEFLRESPRFKHASRGH
jgi:hypothetical protein